MRSIAIVLTGTLGLALAACAPGGSQPADLADAQGDASVAPPDTGSSATDDATTTDDTAEGPTDVATPPADAADTAAPPSDTATPPSDTATPTGGAPVGGACASAADCAGETAQCLADFPGGYCVIPHCGSQGATCPAGSSCWGFGAGNPNLCIADCTSDAQCRVAEGYECDADNTCWPGSGTPTGGSPVGGACQADSDCGDPGAFCYPPAVQGSATGFYQGYCMIADCTAGSCPSGARCESIFVGGGTACVGACDSAADCQPGYGCFQPGMCWPSCASHPCALGFACDAAEDICVPACQTSGCPSGLHCWPDGTCGAPPCTPGSCTSGYVCDTASGHCIPDLAGGPGPGPGPSCPSVPSPDCTEGAAVCGALTLFEPLLGPGWENYPINGETPTNLYRSYAREDLQRLIKWATGMVDCKAASWGGGNGAPLGLGDMSEADGAIPGTSVGFPGHPPGTHTNGFDMDIAYYQQAGPNNHLRPVCPHTINGQTQYRCVAPPDNFDLWRSAYFIGLLTSHPRTRVVGVDGQIGPLVAQAIEVLCAQGWLSGAGTCAGHKIAWEATPGNLGWYHHHHHHLHVSITATPSSAPSLPGGGGDGTTPCKRADCAPMPPDTAHACGLDHPAVNPPPRPLQKRGPR